jgi:hypothetical protein
MPMTRRFVHISKRGTGESNADTTKACLPGMLRGKGWRAGGVAEPLLWYLPFIRTFLQLAGDVAEPMFGYLPFIRSSPITRRLRDTGCQRIVQAAVAGPDTFWNFTWWL